jgi:uncharacterized SAM-binding protein YcdF (DUF218 family)
MAEQTQSQPTGPDEVVPSPRGRKRLVVARAVALFIGGFSLLNLAGALLAPGFDANGWWIDLRPLPDVCSRTLLGVFGVLMLAWAIRPRMNTGLRAIVAIVLAVVLGATIWNVIHFYQLLNQKEIAWTVEWCQPAPFSLFVALALLLVMTRVVRKPAPAKCSVGRSLLGVMVFAVCLVVFPLLQMACFGKTDYRGKVTGKTPADAIVVLGARTYADGRASMALHDRVATGALLYRGGLAPRLILSGGQGDGTVHETEAMRDLAHQQGVNSEDIILDAEGVNTASTVANTCVILKQLHAQRILVVSHFYHLPRIKMCYQRESARQGMKLEVYTVPAEEERTLPRLPYYMAREVAALWAYYLMPLAH